MRKTVRQTETETERGDDRKAMPRFDYDGEEKERKSGRSKRAG